MEKEILLPKNVRQIGDIQGNRRIYMEDYVMTYIHRKEQQEDQGFLGVFLGERRETEDGTLLFIRGLVEAPKEEETERGGLTRKQKEMRGAEAEAERGNGLTRKQKKMRDAEEEEEAERDSHLIRKQKKMRGVEEETERRSGRPEEQKGRDSAGTGEQREIPGTSAELYVRETNGGKDSIEKEGSFLNTEKVPAAQTFSDTDGFSDFGNEDEKSGMRRTVIEECREFFGPEEIQGCCVIGEYPVKRMESLAEEAPQSRQFLYHLQEQEETLYWAEAEKYEQIPGYFVFYELNKEMQEYMAETFGEESEQDRISDRAIKNFREKIRKKDQIKLTGMLKLASSFFAIAVLMIGAVVINRIEARRNGNVMVEAPENEAQNQLPSNPTVMMRSGEGTDSSSFGVTGTGNGAGGQDISDAAAAVNSAAGMSATSTGAGNSSGISGTNTGATGVDTAQEGSTTGSGSSEASVETSGGAGTSGTNARAAGADTAQEGSTSGSESAGTSGETSGGAGTSGTNAGDTVQEGSVAGLESDGTSVETSGGTGTSGTNAGATGTMDSRTGTDQLSSDAAAVSGTNVAAIIQNGVGGTGEPSAQEEMNGADTQSAQDQTAGSDLDTEAGIQAGGSRQSETGSAAGTVTDGTGTAQVWAAQTSGNGTVQTAGTMTGKVSETGAAQADDAGTEEISGGSTGEAVEASSRQTRSSYVIREGDTLADICQTYYGDLNKLSLICEANAIENADMIMPGQKIVLP